MFDKGKPFGEVFGVSEVKYEQEGKLYNGQFKEVSLDGKLKRQKPQVKAVTESPSE